jgi:phospholipid N-methyltransferase
MTSTPSSYLDFFLGFLRHPSRVGSVIPSSRFLEQQIVSAAGLERARCAVELGPGTGGTTRALLQALPAEATLLTIELDDQFSAGLNAIGDPRLINHTGSAADLISILDHHQLPAVDVVVSGIPFSTMPPAVSAAVLKAVDSALAPGGRFVAYQFRSHVAKLAEPVFGPARSVSRAWLNVPPMRCYQWATTPAPQPAPVA